jgi:beta-galactosidase/beta-glucuronidase
MKFIFFLLLTFNLQLSTFNPSFGQETETQLLSGWDKDHTVDWDFYCTGGRNSGKWTKIPVPSNWELKGFGTYNYGREKVKSDEKGLYKYQFKLKPEWKKKRVFIVFEGSMTDTKVKINGKLAGPVHQGVFYRFKYEIGKLLDFKGKNLLEVEVAKKSADTSVNRAERDAYYWVFGGIYRPVYLEAVPEVFIE